MYLLPKAALIALSLFTLTCGSPSAAQTLEASSQPWAQVGSDLKPDPALRFGTLPNGMRYVLRRNVTPPGQMLFRMRIDAGSLVEKDDQLGIAHFLEHMLFNGTTHLPGDKMTELLKQHNIGWNASTGFGETIYLYALPRNDEKTVNAALYALREKVSEAVFDPVEVDAERGVIAAERRNGAQRIERQIAEYRIVAPRLAERIVIGDADIIRTAPPARFEDFYRAYYRPSRATLVAVGDFDLDAMEAQIKRRFASWTPRGRAGPDADPALNRAPRRGVHVTVQPGSGNSVGLFWTRPSDLSPDSRDKRRRDLLREIGIRIFDQRLNRLSTQTAAPFTSANALDTDLNGVTSFASALAFHAPGGMDEAIAGIEQEQRRLVRYGVTDAELQRQIISMRADLRDAVAGANTRASRTIADALVFNLNGRTVSLSPQQQLDLFEAMVKGLSASQVDEALRRIYPGEAPLVLVGTPTAIAGGEKAIADRLAASRRVAVAPPPKTQNARWDYADFGRPGVVASRRPIPELDATFVTFANGTTLTFKQTRFTEGEVRVSASTGLGELGMSPDRFDPLYGAQAFLVRGGLGKLTYDEVGDALAGRRYSVDATVDPNRFTWSGTTRPADLAVQMQVLAAYVTDPGLRAEPLAALQQRYASLLNATRASPSGVWQAESPRLLTGGDARKTIASAEQFASLDMAAIRPRLRAAIGSGPVHVTIVGDLGIEQAISATAATFGALPPRGPAPVPAQGADRRTFPAGSSTVTRLRHDGAADQALAFIGWAGPDGVNDNPETWRALVMASLLSGRVNKEVRERQGLAYNPSAGLSTSSVFRDASYFGITAQTTPANIAAFYAAVDTIVRDLRTKPVTQAELDVSRGAMLKQLANQRNLNEYWAAVLKVIPYRSDAVERITGDIANVEAVTPADIQRLANKYLRPENAWRAEVTPRAAGSAAAGQGAPAAGRSAS